MTLTTERLNLCQLRPEDADELFGVLNDQRLHEFIGDHPLPLDELQVRYQRLAVGHSDDGKETWFNWIVRLRSNNDPVGTLQATITGTGVDQETEISWVVGVPWQGQGIATEATIALVGWLEQQGFLKISAYIHPDHVASQKVASNAGLTVTDEVGD